MPTQSSVAIRRGEPGDLADVVSLLGNHHGLLDTTNLAKALAMLIEDHHRALVVVAEANGLVVGVATMQIFISTAQGGAVGRVEDVVVAPSHSGHGIGRALLSTLWRSAQTASITRLICRVGNDNTHALQFFAANGWRTDDCTSLAYGDLPQTGTAGGYRSVPSSIIETGGFPGITE